MKFSVKQRKAIKLLSIGTNYRQCCIQLGISRYALWQWRKNKAFLDAIESEKLTYINDYSEDLDKFKKKAISTLTNFLDDDSVPMETRISIAFDAINIAKTIQVNCLN